MPQQKSGRSWPPVPQNTPRRPAPAIPGFPLTDRVKRLQNHGPILDMVARDKNEPRVIMTRRQSAKARSKISPLEPETLPATEPTPPTTKTKARPAESHVEGSDTHEAESREDEDDEGEEDDNDDNDDEGERNQETRRYRDPGRYASRTTRHTSESSDIDQELFERRFSRPMILSQLRRYDNQHSDTNTPKAKNTETRPGLHDSTSGYPNCVPRIHESSERQQDPANGYHEDNVGLADLYDRLQTVHGNERLQRKQREEAGYTIGELERHDGEKRKANTLYGDSVERGLSQLLINPGIPQLYAPTSQPMSWWIRTVRWMKSLSVRNLWRQKTMWEKLKGGEIGELVEDVKRLCLGKKKKGWW
ncbi:hypothetical protein TWF696_005391 [Orbilia brochopaga]|uniref:Uncharacterized protein n=1 Tax=Orbilia brochopaga TaxID=3140254 RepID=A0AAV9V3Y1_9PEZI